MEAFLPLTYEVCQKNTRCINALNSKIVFYYNNNLELFSVKLRPFYRHRLWLSPGIQAY